MLLVYISKYCKTLGSLDPIYALRSMGFSVFAAKSSREYVDCSWLAWNYGYHITNLDLQMVAEDSINNLCTRRLKQHLKNGFILSPIKIFSV